MSCRMGARPGWQRQRGSLGLDETVKLQLRKTINSHNSCSTYSILVVPLCGFAGRGGHCCSIFICCTILLLYNFYSYVCGSVRRRSFRRRCARVGRFKSIFRGKRARRGETASPTRQAIAYPRPTSILITLHFTCVHVVTLDYTSQMHSLTNTNL